MPPKKRKASPDSDNEGQGSSRVTKAKKSQTEDTESSSTSLAPNGQPTNKSLPTSIQFPDKVEGTIRISSWNVSGLAASQKKGFKSYVEAEDPDILILTETKVNNEPVDPTLTTRFPHRYWSISEKKGYSGTAVLSKHKALSVTKDLPNHPDQKSVKGRIVTLEFEKFYLVATYVVNAGQGLKTLPEKEEWNKHFEVYIRELDKKKPVIWAGDLNVAPTEKDLTHAKSNWNKTPGYTESETSAFARILNSPASNEKEEGEGESEEITVSGKFKDVWRDLHPNDKHYTYFSYRFNCRSKGIGWRLDMFVLSERITSQVKMCEIRSEIYGASDHCPIVLEIADIV